MATCILIEGEVEGEAEGEGEGKMYKLNLNCFKTASIFDFDIL